MSEYADDAAAKWAEGWVSLAECPVGMFMTESKTLCLKTEYGGGDTMVDAYIISSGERFWGNHPQTADNQRRQLVRPVDVVHVHPLMRCETCEGEGIDPNGKYQDDDCPDCDGACWVRS